MLQKMRTGAQSVGAKILAMIICFVLVVFGFGAFNLFAVSPPAAAVVNGEDITEEGLRNATRLQRQNFLSMYGDQFSQEYIESVVTPGSVLRQLVNTELLVQEAESLGLAPSRAKFERAVQTNPAFMEDGEFSEDRFQQTLASAGFSTQTYEARSGRESLSTLWTDLSTNTSFVTDAEIKHATEVTYQRRDIAYITFDPNMVINDIEVSDEEITEYYESNLDSYMTEEEFTFEYVELKSSDYEQDLEMEEEELRELYEAENQVALSNARRRGSHILLNTGDGYRTEEEARNLFATVRSRIDGGESFADIASELSEDFGSAGQGGDLGFSSRGAFVPEFEDALFNLNVGEISAPVKTTYGLHIIQLNEVEQVELPPFEERRGELKSIRIAELALDEFDARRAQLDEITYEQSESLDGAVAELGLEIKTLEGVTRGSGEGPFSSYAVRSIFLETDVIRNGFNSRLADVDTGHVIVGRLVSLVTPRLKSLDEVLTEVTSWVRVQKSREMVTAQRDEALALLKETGRYSDVSGDGKEWVTRQAVLANDPEIPAAILSVAFGLRAPTGLDRQIAPVDGPGADRTIVVVSRATPGDIEATPEAEKLELSDSLATYMSNRDLLAFIYALREEADLEFLVPEEQ